METRTASVRLRVVGDDVRLANGHLVAKGDYEGYVDSAGDPEHMTAVQIVIGGISSMDSEVLRFVKSGEIEIIA